MADTNTYNSFQKVEKWTTREKFNALDLSTIETGTEYNLTGAIDETDLASDLLTKINGKLTSPTTPTADSAVTMLADGTVGTKPLSEIGGGKLYLHQINVTFNNTIGDIYVNIINNSNTKLTENDFRKYVGYGNVACFNGPIGIGAIRIYYNTNYTNYTMNGALAKSSSSGGYLHTTDTIQTLLDYVTEL